MQKKLGKNHLQKHFFILKNSIKINIDIQRKMYYNLYQMIHFLRRYFVDGLNSFVSSLFLFRGIDSDKVSLMLKKIKPEVISYQRTKKIYTPTDYVYKILTLASHKTFLLYFSRN